MPVIPLTDFDKRRSVGTVLISYLYRGIANNLHLQNQCKTNIKEKQVKSMF